MIAPDPAKPKFLNAARLKAVGQGILLWVVIWLGISVARQDFSLEYLLLLPLALLHLTSPPHETAGVWFYVGPLFVIYSLPWLLTARFRKANREFLVLAFFWAATLALLGEPVAPALKVAAVAGISLWIFLGARRMHRALRAEQEEALGPPADP